MSGSIVVKCPDYVSGMCTRHGCDGILARPFWTGTGDDGGELYAASCPHGSDLFRNLTAEIVEVAPPDFADLESCRQFCNILYAEIREKLKSKVHSETQAVSYILSGAKAGELYYDDCLMARRIRKEWNWTRTTFTTYCKQKFAPKPKTIKRAAKKGRHIRERKRMLRDL